MFMYKRKILIYICTMYIFILTGLCIGKFINNKITTKDSSSSHHRINILTVTNDTPVISVIYSGEAE